MEPSIQAHSVPGSRQTETQPSHQWLLHLTLQLGVPAIAHGVVTTRLDGIVQLGTATRHRNLPPAHGPVAALTAAAVETAANLDDAGLTAGILIEQW